MALDITLKQALAQSRLQPEPLPIEFVGDLADLVAGITALWAGEIDYAPELDGAIDIFGWEGDDPNEMDFRLTVTLKEK